MAQMRAVVAEGSDGPDGREITESGHVYLK